MRLLLTLLCTGLVALSAYAGTIAEDVAKLNIPKDDLLKMGEALYHTEGTNTCVYCHGKGGHGGNQAGAADLRHPKTWRAYQALGGDAAFNGNKEKFMKDMEESLLFLIRQGGPVWNLQFEKKHPAIKYDWSKVTVPDKADKYNSMMKGITSGPMANQIKDVVGEKLKLKGAEAQDVAAVAAFTYVKTLDAGDEQGGVFK
jgi:cytochrome c553